MNSIGKQIQTMETNLYNIESALDVAVSQKDKTELLRKQTKLTKKLSKLKRRMNNTDEPVVIHNQNNREWR